MFGHVEFGSYSWLRLITLVLAPLFYRYPLTSTPMSSEEFARWKLHAKLTGDRTCKLSGDSLKLRT